MTWCWGSGRTGRSSRSACRTTPRTWCCRSTRVAARASRCGVLRRRCCSGAVSPRSWTTSWCLTRRCGGCRTWRTRMTSRRSTTSCAGWTRRSRGAGEFIRAHTDIYGNLTGSPGPRLVVFLEEQNLMMNRLQAYWSELLAEDKALPKDMRENLPAVSPAIRGFEAASYAGRELKVHLCFVAQRFTAEAAGGGAKGASVRMNAGIAAARRVTTTTRGRCWSARTCRCRRRRSTRAGSRCS